MDLARKRMLITGGSSGIGLEIARAALGQGARVIITGRSPERMGAALGELGSAAEVWSILGDVSCDRDRRQMLEAAVRFLGGLDILVNNAGAVRAGRLEEMDDGAIRTMIEVNLLAPILLTRAALPHLRASGEALVVNISSGIALIGMPFYTSYAAAKAGLSHFGEALRRELDDERVKVLTVYPTATDTPMMASSRLDPPEGRESPRDVARAVIEAILEDRRDVIRGTPDRQKMIALNRSDPASVDSALRFGKAIFEEAVRDHSSF